MSERGEGDRRVVMCRFVSGTLVQESIDFRTAEYIAFSHVWGAPGEYAWRDVAGIPFPIIVSESKARFLEQSLTSLVGDAYFWMDVICVDQGEDIKSVEKRIKMTTVFPDIFNRAKKTIVIRDGLGFKSCCAQVIGQLPGWDAYKPAVQRLADHWRTEHRSDVLYEGILERLWPLQEAILSNNLQFVSCEEREKKKEMSFQTIYPEMYRATAYIDRLWTLSRAWASYGRVERSSADEQLSFLRSVLNNGTVARSVPVRSPFPSEIGVEFVIQSNSIRATSKVRDLILCTMAQYDWYTPPRPEDVRKMDNEPGGALPRLFKDCFLQAREADRAVLPKITGGMVGENTNILATSNIPMPKSLGDLVKLFGLVTEGAPRHDLDVAVGLDFGPVEIRTIQPDNMAEVLDFLEKAIIFSSTVWDFALKGELSPLAAWADDKKFTTAIDADSCFENALQFLHLMAIGIVNNGGARMDYDSFKRDLVRANALNYAEPLLRLAALICCGIGISAYEWSIEVLEPVVVVVGKHELLGLLSKSEVLDLDFVRVEKSSINLWLNEPAGCHSLFHIAHPQPSNFRIDFQHMVITRPGEYPKPRHRCVGLLPAFGSEYEDKQVRVERLSELGVGPRYGGLSVNLI
ncbi:hypothetical protein PV04_05065 [Phialophora macrospora]|uniref:Heterokaryon incompatibility domain-containing protein n=1 Tax=Phialophora macrospora TaxID=1851006 RepID=A0A0D2E486_9EURO|nr:hypothetical protein PV04_05065 [Phialophora macrospora]